MKTKLRVLIVSFLLLFGIIIAGCGEQATPKQATNAAK